MTRFNQAIHLAAVCVARRIVLPTVGLDLDDPHCEPTRVGVVVDEDLVEELGRDRAVGLVRRRQHGRGDHAGPADEQVQAQTVVDLVRHRIVPDDRREAERGAAVAGQREVETAAEKPHRMPVPEVGEGERNGRLAI